MYQAAMKLRHYVMFALIKAIINRNAANIAQSPETFDGAMRIIEDANLPEYKEAHLMNHLIDAMGYY